MSNPNPLPFPKTGAAANPNGRPKRAWTVQGLIEDAMEEADETGVPAKKLIYQKLVKLAKNGDIQAIRELNDRLDGKPVQKNVLAGDEENPIRVDITATLKKAYGQRIIKTTRGVSKNSK